MSLYEAVFGGELPETTAMISGDLTLTYPQLAERVADCAAQLAARGIGQHDVVGVQLGNGADFATVFHGVVKLGAIVAPLPLHLRSDERDAMLRSVAASLLVDETNVREVVRPRGSLPSPAPQISPEQLACLPFSSGTTGTPKAVMLPHRALAANVRQFSQVLPLQAWETCLSVLPFSHIYGLTALLNVPLAMRARVVAQNFAKDSFLAAHDRHDVALTFIAPPLAAVLASAPAEYKFSSLTTIVSGAAPLDPALARRAAERTGARVIQGFGLTESSPVTHLAWRPGTPLEAIGHPLPDTEISIRDPHTLAEATEGEMWVRGPQVMAGYLGDPDVSSRTLIDGWLRTGDLVRENPDGSHTVIDRLKDLIKYHGFQVSPVKLERIVMTHPEVADAAVTRGYGPDGEEQPEAYVVLHSGSETDQDTIMTAVATQVARHEQLRKVHFVSHIPRSAAGKILRRHLTAD
ncbi:AMP-binding protein [Corynebacterium hindlerae]|uniref:class I adenylate-forming enzyme family protein n=1 Tax=Corynebacterium hindlerae TaxID=699041 RepID=UPI001AD64C1F|nr:AMP-binding protein [Corynebacterium hindlerae]QTH59416.1 AMP-binding protein [Corynebacterium hindlerae]